MKIEVTNGRLATVLARCLLDQFGGGFSNEQKFIEFQNELMTVAAKYIGGEANEVAASLGKTWDETFVGTVHIKDCEEPATSLWCQAGGENAWNPILLAFKRMGLEFHNSISVFGSPDDNPYVMAAKETAVGDEDVDFDQECVVAESDEGAFVQGWHWVSRSDAKPANSDLLEGIVDFAQASGNNSPLMCEYLTWAEDLIANFSDELDELKQDSDLTAPKPIVWMTMDGTSIEFVPSDAILAIAQEAKKNQMPDRFAQRIEEFCQKLGPSLDSKLTCLAVPA